jgi:hypothetical protein
MLKFLFLAAWLEYVQQEEVYQQQQQLTTPRSFLKQEQRSQED